MPGRWSGTDGALEGLARRNALALGAGHGFIVFLGDGFYPINVLNAIKMVADAVIEWRHSLLRKIGYKL